MYELALKEGEAVEVDENKENDVTQRAPKPPPQAPPVVADDVKKHVQTINAFTIVKSVSLDDGKMLKFSYPYTVVGVTHMVWASLMEFFKAEPGRLRYVQDKIDSAMSTNNTIIAALNSMKLRLPAKEKVFDYNDTIKAYVAEHLPMAELDDTIGDSIPWERADIFDIVASADAGMPYMATDRGAKCGKVSVYKNARQKANSYYKMLSSEAAFNVKDKNSFSSYVKEHELDFLFLLKRKFERMERLKLDNKVRVYYVLPYALKLLFKWVSFYCRKASVNFIDNPASSSAYKFCWSNGGAEKLLKWVNSWEEEAKVTGKVVFRAVCFGDDQFWVFTYPSGVRVITCPDVKAQDDNTPSVVGSYYVARHVVAFKKKPPQGYINVCRYLAKSAFQQMVLVNGSLVAVKRYGLVSGVPLTTMFDMDGAVITQYYAEASVRGMNIGHNKLKPKTFDEIDFKKTLDVIAKTVQEKVGYTFKPETLVYEVHRGPVLEFNLPFLGYIVQLHPEYKKPFPIPKDLSACWASAALPSAPVTTKYTMDLILARLYGLCLSGYWCNSQFYDFAVGLFQYCQKQGARLNHIETGSLTIPQKDLDNFMNQHPMIPSKDELLRFYLGLDSPEAETDKTEQNIARGMVAELPPMESLPIRPIAPAMVGNTLPKVSKEQKAIERNQRLTKSVSSRMKNMRMRPSSHRAGEYSPVPSDDEEEVKNSEIISVHFDPEDSFDQLVAEEEAKLKKKKQLDEEDGGVNWVEDEDEDRFNDHPEAHKGKSWGFGD